MAKPQEDARAVYRESEGERESEREREKEPFALNPKPETLNPKTLKPKP